ncbi:HsmA family protein [Microbacterium sp. RG1]|uniref:HsmA family protein n=1 Tax=Microbacterium sp. RG1 TaxID=2489212 RepID=UPI0010CA5F32|nr:HsmA family protein [Microbacterium sp. RG1]QCQ16603.1 TIGR03987 family protein [Microbacterium sp. RG1]
MLIIAIVIITLALVFYTVGIWSERIQRRLKWWHVFFFAAGLAADATGTALMRLIASDRRAMGVEEGPAAVLMAWTGTAAILLMALHLLWAIVVLIRDRERELIAFHRFSLLVWAIWLVPYLAGAASAMVK